MSQEERERIISMEAARAQRLAQARGKVVGGIAPGCNGVMRQVEKFCPDGSWKLVSMDANRSAWRRQPGEEQPES